MKPRNKTVSLRRLRSKRFRSSSSRKLEREQKKEWRRKGRGVKEPYQAVPPPSIFFLLPLQISRYNSTGNACYAG